MRNISLAPKGIPLMIACPSCLIRIMRKVRYPPRKKNIRQVRIFHLFRRLNGTFLPVDRLSFIDAAINKAPIKTRNIDEMCMEIIVYGVISLDRLAVSLKRVHFG